MTCQPKRIWRGSLAKRGLDSTGIIGGQVQQALLARRRFDQVWVVPIGRIGLLIRRVMYAVIGLDIEDVSVDSLRNEDVYNVVDLVRNETGIIEVRRPVFIFLGCRVSPLPRIDLELVVLKRLDRIRQRSVRAVGIY